MNITLIVTLVSLLVIVFYVVGIFNKLVTLRNRFQNAFAQIEVQLKRRYDLIPNLVETAKSYLKHEAGTLEAVTKARGAAENALSKASSNLADPSAMKNLGKAEASLNDSLGKFNLVMEAYPDLKTSQNMMQLSEELTSTENKIAFARQAYNDEVMFYNTYKQSFPPVIFSNMFGHGPDSSLLEFEDKAAIQNAPKVSF